MYRTHGSAWYPLFSMIFKYRTWIPDVVKYGISNLTAMGGFLSGSSTNEMMTNAPLLRQHTRFHTGQAKVSTENKFFATRELLNLPDDGILFRSIRSTANGSLELWRIRIFWNGDRDFDVVGCRSTFELGFGLERMSSIPMPLSPTLIIYSTRPPKCSTADSHQMSGLT